MRSSCREFSKLIQPNPRRPDFCNNRSRARQGGACCRDTDRGRREGAPVPFKKGAVASPLLVPSHGSWCLYAVAARTRGLRSDLAKWCDHARDGESAHWITHNPPGKRRCRPPALSQCRAVAGRARRARAQFTQSCSTPVYVAARVGSVKSHSLPSYRFQCKIRNTYKSESVCA